MSNKDGFDSKSYAFVTASIRLVSESVKMLRVSGSSVEVSYLEDALNHMIAAKKIVMARLD